jgi:hypothetical protein
MVPWSVVLPAEGPAGGSPSSECKSGPVQSGGVSYVSDMRKEEVTRSMRQVTSIEAHALRNIAEEFGVSDSLCNRLLHNV